jgi:hypothetical protein
MGQPVAPALPSWSWARLDRLEVYGTASKPKHNQVMRLGSIPIDYRDEDFVARVAAPTGGRGVDAAFDPIGGGHPSQEPGGSASDCARLDRSWLGAVPRVRQRSDGVRGGYVVPCLAFYNAMARPGISWVQRQAQRDAERRKWEAEAYLA